jgi:hypothetical protein
MDEPHEMSERPDIQATFVHFDDLRPQRVRTQRHPDGSERSVWDRWFVISRDPQLFALHTTWDPDVVVHRHGHLGHHGVYVMRGGMWAGDRWCDPGTYIDVPLGAAAGPYVAGPEGVDLFEFTMGDGRSWEADPDGFVALLAERGITPLPNPPIELPDWLEDQRRDHTGLVAPSDD